MGNLATIPDTVRHSGAGRNPVNENISRNAGQNLTAFLIEPLLAWMPLIGDALCLAAGWLRLNWWQAALFMTIGKFARYVVIAMAIV